MSAPTVKFPYTWEQAIEILRNDPEHQLLVADAYLTEDISDNCKRFAASEEFEATLILINRYRPDAQDLLDIPSGNGIATYAFTRAGFNVTSVEPDPSPSVGRGAIKLALAAEGLNANIVAAFGESLPFASERFDVVYVRQGLHHAHDLKRMLGEYARVLKPGGILVAAREHVVDDYGRSLKRFLASQVDHQLYGGENAFTLEDYYAAFTTAEFRALEEFAPYNSPINLHPNTPDRLQAKILKSAPGRVLAVFLPTHIVYRIGMWRLRRTRLPGRLYTFVLMRN